MHSLIVLMSTSTCAKYISGYVCNTLVFVHVCDNNVLVSFVPVQPIYTIIQVTGETISSLGEGGAIGQITDLCFSTSCVEYLNSLMLVTEHLKGRWKTNCIYVTDSAWYPVWDLCT